MARFKVGVQLRPQHCTMDQLREAWTAADALEVDTIWTWDHFYPLFGEPDGPHYECWTTLAAIAATTRHARFGALVTCNSYRNPELLADMARTINEISGGRAILGIGAGWFERDYTEYGYEFGDAPGRLRALKEALPRIKSRLAKLNPAAPDLPIMIGGSGPKVTLRLTAEYAQLWNGMGDPATFAEKVRILDDWCAEIGRDPKEIDRTVMINNDRLDQVDEYLEAGATHIILGSDAPFDLEPLTRLLKLARG
ncbi:LLM class F420-dependent oxidoreductase [Actinospica sp. MGRD01-02]|uniref:LLM class F420-dependent oxidoreductase n=1 Tax=Actinospica acidithermotolerans TaxID=2828514 RepID=A0A941ECJ4_9ACTN|nr:LLM class F420-dependent oxidoreductase [Actinospica acidithermotolerans]MBR7828951.1 LLM class F420-dependent oxidoreductase [Actinospica acidithermotolerans]